MSNIAKDIGKLGFGLMRLPMKDGKIDIEQSARMTDAFLEAGFNYFDTARVYGESEDATRRFLVERHPRESFKLATKIAPWMNGCDSREKVIAQFEQSLKNTGTDYFDFYLLHNLGKDRTKLCEEFGLWDWALEQKKKGLIRHLGFSFHSTADDLDSILNAHPETEFVQLQINYADWESGVQSRACYEVARKHGKPIIVMEPVKGGLLANPHDSVCDIFRAAEPQASPASWALRFAADLDGVITVLSGMSNMAQMEDNLSFMKGFTHLTEAQRETIEKAKKALVEIPLIPCTSCNYCSKVCPKNIGISDSFSAMNHYTLYQNKGSAIRQLKNSVDAKEMNRADACIACGACEGICPQHIEIRAELEKAAEILK